MVFKALEQQLTAGFRSAASIVGPTRRLPIFKSFLEEGVSPPPQTFSSTCRTSGSGDDDSSNRLPHPPPVGWPGGPSWIFRSLINFPKLKSSFPFFSPVVGRSALFQHFAAILLFLLLAAPSSPAAEPWLSSLASPPEWRLLDRYQKSITRAEFETLLKQVYSIDGDFLRYLDLSDEKAVVWREPEKTHLLWTLEFAPSAETTENRPSLYYPTDTSDLRNATPDLPLKGLRILLDPGHIGGEWAEMEQRDLRIDKNVPVQEASLNLLACRRLAQLLEKAGAEVLWTKTGLDPVTPLRPKNLQAEALDLIFSRNPDAAKLKDEDQLAAAKTRSELLFYRVAEIQARADLAKRLHPDLTLCVHFNAAPDPNPGHPGLFDKNRLVIFVNGSYLPDELVFDDIKFNLLEKILERSNPVESAIARDVGHAMEQNWKLPPEAYTNWPSANRTTDSPYVWSRNLIANRLYPGPVVFVEGPYMNDRSTYDRLIVGDYDGIQVIDGLPHRSIFEEYAEIIYEGVLAYYTNPLPDPSVLHPPPVQSQASLTPPLSSPPASPVTPPENPAPPLPSAP